MGPTFKVSTKANIALDASVDMVVSLAYNFDDAKLFFPENDDEFKSSGNFVPNDSGQCSK